MEEVVNLIKHFFAGQSGNLVSSASQKTNQKSLASSLTQVATYAAAAVAQSVKRPRLRSLKRGATELT